MVDGQSPRSHEPNFPLPCHQSPVSLSVPAFVIFTRFVHRNRICTWCSVFMYRYHIVAHSHVILNSNDNQLLRIQFDHPVRLVLYLIHSSHRWGCWLLCYYTNLGDLWIDLRWPLAIYTMSFRPFPTISDVLQCFYGISNVCSLISDLSLHQWTIYAFPIL